MKKAGAAALFIGVLLASLLTSAPATSEQIHERKLMIAIDDGTEDGQLFIEMDGGDATMLPDDPLLGEPRSYVDVMQSVRAEQTDNPGGVMIISGSTIDDKTRNCIRSILSSSGHSGEVIFLDDYEAAGHLNGVHDAVNASELPRMQTISKEISATN